MKEETTKTYITTKDFFVSGETYDLLWDDNLKLLKTHPQPSEEELYKYYESSEYISHTDSKKGLFNLLYQTIKNYSLRKKVKLITGLSGRAGRLLDIGAGTGEFLKCASEEKWNVNGVEVNESARNLSLKKGIQLEESLNSFELKNFDVVTLWHVLEHLPNLTGTITKIEELIQEEGYLIIAVPNFKSYDANYYKEYWAAYDVPRHLWHFSQESMELLFSSKMKLVMKKPMIFDSFYVSLLSEKYKSGKSFSLKAAFIGLKSNILAWRSKEYSSLIYIFKKTN